ncbi:MULTISPECIES: TIGR03621 family F420-dependent LLM class oxidoreductase [unclassified Frankia]|uniref:TIGR03621 family F420-dependent LLM class oxidoreductase n=1 Tax=unclassified Frankia TaxID=2632575 RepID=UPI002AD46003|nr:MULTISPECIES: TIGR03621 family F420-dependent LLM class oxidoreductase [unclassified Frankia]
MSRAKPFRFGLQAYQATSAEQWRALAREAEQLGYSTFHLADHYFGPGPLEAETRHPVQDLAAIPAMAVAAAETETIRIGCRVLCIDYHLPAVLAKELATLDFLSGGRLEIGLGAGWIEAEYRAMGIRWDRPGVRLQRLEEVIDLLEAHFGGEQIAVAGTHVQVSGYQGVPAPVQTPRPPFMVGGGGERILRLAGRRADIVSLNFDNRSGRIGSDGVGSSTADATDRKIGWVREGAGDRFERLELEIAAYFTMVGVDPPKAQAHLSGALGLPPETLADHPHVLAGSVDEICERLVARRERYGISYVTVGARVLEDFAPVVARLAGT